MPYMGGGIVSDQRRQARGILSSGSTGEYLDQLAAWFSMDQASGGEIDSHTSGVTLDDETTNPGSGAGVVGNCRIFTAAVSDRLVCADNATMSLSTDTAFTWCGFAKMATVSTQQLLAKWDTVSGASIEYELRYVDGGGLRLFVGNNTTSANVIEPTIWSADTWYFVCAQHDPVANTLGVSINDGAFTTAAWSGGTFDGTASFKFCGNIGGAGYWNGSLDNWSFHKKVLTAAQITWLYNAGSGRSYAVAATA